MLAVDILFIFSVSAQTYNEQVNIVAPYEPSVNDANKINTEPGKYNITLNKTTPEYDFTSYKHSIFAKTPAKLSLLAPSDYEKEVSKHILSTKLGFGTNIEPLVNIYINSIENSKISGGFQIFHNSAWRQMKDVTANTSFSNTNVSGYGIFSIGEQKLQPEISYSHNSLYYYSAIFSKEYVKDSFPDDSIKQTVDILETSISLFNAKKHDFNYNASINYSFLKDKFDYTEHEFILPAYINYTPQNLRNYLISASFKLDYFVSSAIDKNNYLANLTLLNYYTAGAFEFKVGLSTDLYSENTNTLTQSKVALHPIAEIKVNIIPQTFNIHLGVDGNSNRNTFKYLYQDNQFLSSLASIQREIIDSVSPSAYTYPSYITNTKFNFHAGFDSKIGKNMNFSANVEYKFIDQLPVFVSQWHKLSYSIETYSNEAYMNKYIVQYADIDQLSISSEITLDTKNGFITNLHGKYNINKLNNKDEIAELYNLPDYEIYLTSKYTFPNKKFSLGLETYSIGKRKDLHKLYNSTDPYANVDLDPIYDFNVSADYMFNNTFSVWAKFNNLLHYSNKTQLWQYYYEYPLNCMIGVTMAM